MYLNQSHIKGDVIIPSKLSMSFSKLGAAVE